MALKRMRKEAPAPTATATPTATFDRQERAALIRRLRADGHRIAAQFGLQPDAILAESGRVRRRYGSCHSDGRIKIRLTHARTGRPLKYSSLIDTLCHELAHLKHFDHSPRFKAYYLRILSWARAEGIYSPRPRYGAAARRETPGAGFAEAVRFLKDVLQGGARAPAEKPEAVEESGQMRLL